MCSVTHVAAGALVGSFLGNGLLAFGLGFASHIPLDMIPHIDFEDFRIDAFATVCLLGGIMVVAGPSPIFWGALGSVAPDFENLLWKTNIIRERQKIFPTHSGLIAHGRARAAKGIATEVLVSAFSVAIVALAVFIGGETH
jgi:hypothetical protein